VDNVFVVCAMLKTNFKIMVHFRNRPLITDLIIADLIIADLIITDHAHNRPRS